MQAGRVWTAVLVASAMLVGPVSSAVSAGDPQLPRLAMLPPDELLVQGNELRFTTRIANRGSYPLDLVGVPTAADTARALQCVRWAAPHVCLLRDEVGSFVWHPEHGHFHFEDFALYELRRLDTTGQPDMTPDGLVSTSGKVSFCLQDVQPDHAEPPPGYENGNPVYYVCLSGWQGISPGWQDIYHRGLPGQFVPIAGVPPGSYALVVTSDPDERLAQTDRDDAVAWTVWKN